MVPVPGSPWARPMCCDRLTPAYSVPASTAGRVRKVVAGASGAGCGQTGLPSVTLTAWISTVPPSSIVWTPT